MKRPQPSCCGPLAVAIVGLVVAGCGDGRAIRPDDVRSYVVAKQPAAAVSPDGEPAPPSTTVRYDVPSGWRDLGGGGMRLTTLAIGSPEAGQEVTLSRARGKPRDNVIRWQRQLVGEADPAAVEASADRALAAAETVDVTGTPATIVLLDATGFPDAQAARDQAILAAIIPVDDDSLFVKFRGSAAVAGREKDNFRRFVASLRWK